MYQHCRDKQRKVGCNCARTAYKTRNNYPLIRVADLEAVPRAVIQAWKIPRKKVKGFFLTMTK